MVRLVMLTAREGESLRMIFGVRGVRSSSSQAMG